MQTTHLSSSLIKLSYHPIDAAVRWCDLLEHEAQILQAARHSPARLAQFFRQWPTLWARTETLFDAVRNGELQYGCLGMPVRNCAPIDEALLTIRHNDLKRWMTLYHPDQRPAFLFGSANQPQETISIQSYLVLQADRDALRLQLKHITEAHQQVLEALKAAGLEPDTLGATSRLQGRLSERGELTYQHIIGGLIQLLLGHSPAGKPYSVFDSQAAVVSALIAHFGGIVGMTKRTLDQKFASGRRSLSQP